MKDGGGDGSDDEGSDGSASEEEDNASETVESSFALAPTPSLRFPSVPAGGLIDGLETVLFHLRRQREASTNAISRASLLPAEQLLAPALFGVQAAFDYLRTLEDSNVLSPAVNFARPGYRALENRFQQLLPSVDTAAVPDTITSSFAATRFGSVESNALDLQLNSSDSSTLKVASGPVPHAPALGSSEPPLVAADTSPESESFHRLPATIVEGAAEQVPMDTEPVVGE